MDHIAKAGSTARRAHAGVAVPLILVRHRAEPQAFQVEDCRAGLAAQQIIALQHDAPAVATLPLSF